MQFRVCCIIGFLSLYLVTTWIPYGMKKRNEKFNTARVKHCKSCHKIVKLRFAHKTERSVKRRSRWHTLPSPVAGSETGTCPCCQRDGPLGKICYKCCKEKGMMIGNCVDCNDCGRIGNDCSECPYGEYVNEGPTGICPNCGGYGMQYTAYSNCVDEGKSYV